MANDTGDAPAFQLYPIRPGPGIVKQIVEEIGKTGRPEDYPGLHRGPIDHDEPFEILHNVSIGRDRRKDGTLAPCPMCQPNKFLDGRLVYLFRLQAVAAIGHCCAAGQTNREALNRYRRERLLQQSQDALFAAIPENGARAVRFGDLLPTATEAKRVHRALNAQGGWYLGVLRNATKGGSTLVITRQRRPGRTEGPAGMRTSGSSVQTIDVSFGRLDGQAAITAHFDPVGELQTSIDLLRAYSASDEDGILSILSALDDDEDLIAVARRIKDARKRTAETCRSLRDFRRFFHASNVKRICRWGSQPDAPFPMWAELTEPASGTGPRTFAMWTKGRATVGIEIGSVLYEPIPDDLW